MVALAVTIPLAVIYGRSGTLVNAVSVSWEENIRKVPQHLVSLPQMDVANLRLTLTDLQTIATDNGGNREALGKGYNASVDFIMKRLVSAGYDPVRQPFTYDFWEQVSAPAFAVDGINLPGTVFGNYRFSGSGTTAKGSKIWYCGTGCNASDYAANFKAGDVALVDETLDCTTVTRATLAKEQQASALVVIQNNNLGGGFETAAPLPVLAISNLFGVSIAKASNGVSAAISTDNLVRLVYSANVYASTAGGNQNSVVVAGAHLDSVAAGPGINDDGSGTSILLEMAVQLARLRLSPRNQIVFVFFGAEEAGLLGSAHYVKELKKSDSQYKLAMMLDFDMLGSPNYFFGVYNGTNSSPASGVIQHAFEDYAAGQNIATVPIPFDGRSDYGPFLEIKCPAGGIFTGAEAVKSESDQTQWGGMTRVPFDPCYHQACDTIDNIDWGAMSSSVKMAAHVLEHFAFSRNLAVLLEQ